jgi:YfiH family protein
VVEKVMIEPDWPAPPGVHAVSTERTGGVSTGPYRSLNLAEHVGDEPAAVAANRDELVSALGLATEPCWLEQVHGPDVLDLDTEPSGRADGAVTSDIGRICAVLTADCVPVLLAARDGSRVGAAHAGWRGLAAGVLPAAVARMGISPAQIQAWLGPAIGPASYEVDAGVRDAFVGLRGSLRARSGEPRRSRRRGRLRGQFLHVHRLRAVFLPPPRSAVRAHGHADLARGLKFGIAGPI